MDSVTGGAPWTGVRVLYFPEEAKQLSNVYIFLFAVKKKTIIMSCWYDEDSLVLTATCTVGAATIHVHVCKEGCHHQ